MQVHSSRIASLDWHFEMKSGDKSIIFQLQNCDSYEARLKSLGRSVSGEDEVSNLDNLDSVSEQARLKAQQVI